MSAASSPAPYELRFSFTQELSLGQIKAWIQGLIQDPKYVQFRAGLEIVANHIRCLTEEGDQRGSDCHFKLLLTAEQLAQLTQKPTTDKPYLSNGDYCMENTGLECLFNALIPELEQEQGCFFTLPSRRAVSARDYQVASSSLLYGLVPGPFELGGGVGGQKAPELDQHLRFTHYGVGIAWFNELYRRAQNQPAGAKAQKKQLDWLFAQKELIECTRFVMELKFFLERNLSLFSTENRVIAEFLIRSLDHCCSMITQLHHLNWAIPKNLDRAENKIIVGLMNVAVGLVENMAESCAAKAKWVSFVGSRDNQTLLSSTQVAAMRESASGTNLKPLRDKLRGMGDRCLLTQEDIVQLKLEQDSAPNFSAVIGILNGARDFRRMALPSREDLRAREDIGVAVRDPMLARLPTTALQPAPADKTLQGLAQLRQTLTLLPPRTAAGDEQSHVCEFRFSLNRSVDVKVIFDHLKNIIQAYGETLGAQHPDLAVLKKLHKYSGALVVLDSKGGDMTLCKQGQHFAWVLSSKERAVLMNSQFLQRLWETPFSGDLDGYSFINPTAPAYREWVSPTRVSPVQFRSRDITPFSVVNLDGAPLDPACAIQVASATIDPAVGANRMSDWLRAVYGFGWGFDQAREERELLYPKERILAFWPLWVRLKTLAAQGRDEDYPPHIKHLLDFIQQSSLAAAKTLDEMLLDAQNSDLAFKSLYQITMAVLELDAKRLKDLDSVTQTLCQDLKTVQKMQVYGSHKEVVDLTSLDAALEEFNQEHSFKLRAKLQRHGVGRGIARGDFVARALKAQDHLEQRLIDAGKEKEALNLDLRECNGALVDLQERFNLLVVGTAGRYLQEKTYAYSAFFAQVQRVQQGLKADTSAELCIRELQTRADASFPNQFQEKLWILLEHPALFSLHANFGASGISKNQTKILDRIEVKAVAGQAAQLVLKPGLDDKAKRELVARVKEVMSNLPGKVERILNKVEQAFAKSFPKDWPLLIGCQGGQELFKNFVFENLCNPELAALSQADFVAVLVEQTRVKLQFRATLLAVKDISRMELDQSPHAKWAGLFAPVPSQETQKKVSLALEKRDLLQQRIVTQEQHIFALQAAVKAQAKKVSLNLVEPLFEQLKESLALMYGGSGKKAEILGQLSALAQQSLAAYKRVKQACERTPGYEALDRLDQARNTLQLQLKSLAKAVDFIVRKKDSWWSFLQRLGLRKSKAEQAWVKFCKDHKQELTSNEILESHSSGQPVILSEKDQQTNALRNYVQNYWTHAGTPAGESIGSVKSYIQFDPGLQSPVQREDTISVTAEGARALGVETRAPSTGPLTRVASTALSRVSSVAAAPGSSGALPVASAGLPTLATTTAALTTALPAVVAARAALPPALPGSDHPLAAMAATAGASAEGPFQAGAPGGSRLKRAHAMREKKGVAAPGSGAPDSPFIDPLRDSSC